MSFWNRTRARVTTFTNHPSGDTKQSRLESTTEITQNKHVKVLHYFVDDIK
jgi:DNA repair protein RadC